MSNERRHLRYLITSALLVGPAFGCGGEAEPNAAPIELPATSSEEAETEVMGNTPLDEEEPSGEQNPTGNPGGPERIEEPAVIGDPRPAPAVAEAREEQPPSMEPPRVITMTPRDARPTRPDSRPSVNPVW